jgi:dUTP pyrophosphatase
MTMYPTIPTVLNDGTELPKYAHDGDAGLDLCAAEDVTLLPGEWKMVGSGVSMAIPKGFVGLVVPRSGMGRNGLVLKNTVGVIDSTYRGEIKMPLFNNNPMYVRCKEVGESGRAYTWFEANRDGTVHVRKGDRVAQILIVPVAQANPVKVDKLDETERQDGGFGSTGQGRL